MVPVLSVLRRTRHPGSFVAVRIRTHHDNRDLRERACHRPASLYFLIFEQNQRKVYREVVVAGDLSQDDLDKVTLVPVLSSQLYGESVPDTAGLVYGNDTVYFSQPSLSQLAPGGSGLGNLSLSVPVGMKDTLNNTLSLMGRNAPKSHTGTILRCASPARYGYG